MGKFCFSFANSNFWPWQNLKILIRPQNIQINIRNNVEGEGDLIVSGKSAKAKIDKAEIFDNMASISRRYSFKGSVSRVFWPLFFHDPNLSKHLINRLKYLWFLFRFRRDFRSQICLRDVLNTAETTLWSNISANSYQIRKYLSLFIRGPNRFKSWKKWRSKISWHAPFKESSSLTNVNIAGHNLLQYKDGLVF